MTKKMISLASFGILLLIIGVAGGTFYYVKADKQVSTSINEVYQPKNKKAANNLELTISGDLNYRISQSDDNKFHVEGTTYSLDKSQKFDWKKSETDNTTKIDLTFTKSNKKMPTIGVNFWETDNQAIYLSIPKSYKKITVTGQHHSNINLFDLKTDDLMVNNDGSQFTLSNSKLESLDVKGNSKYISLFDLKVGKDITVNTETSTLDVSNTKASNIRLKNNESEIIASQISGNLEATTENGNISLSEIHGPTTAISQNGTINWDNEHFSNDTTLTTTNGEIFARFESKPKDTTIKTETKNGEVSLFNKKTNQYQTKNSKHTLSIKTTSGDIDVSSDDYDDYDDELDDDF